MGERIVIIGGGFGGAFTARYLKKYGAKDTEIELIDTSNYFVFQPLLPEVASGTISAPDAVTPLRQLLPGVRVRMATVTGVDRDRQTNEYLDGISDKIYAPSIRNGQG
jgi:NADH dehydrogenase